MSRIEPIEYNSRLREITAVLRRHNITRGVTPKKLRAILEDVMLDIMFEIPSRGDIASCRITEKTIEKEQPPLLVETGAAALPASKGEKKPRRSA